MCVRSSNAIARFVRLAFATIRFERLWFTQVAKRYSCPASFFKRRRAPWVCFPWSFFRRLRCRYDNRLQLQKIAVYPVIAGKLRVKGRRQHPALLCRHHRPVGQARQHLHRRANRLDLRCADVQRDQQIVEQ